MSKNKKLLKNSMYLYMLTIVKLTFPLLTLPYLTRVLSVETYGFVSYVKAYVSYVQLFIDFGFLLSATRGIAEAKGNIKKTSIITWNTLIEKCILGIISIIITLLAIYRIPILNSNTTFVWLYVISSIITIFIPDFLYRGIEKMEYAAIPFSISKFITIILTFLTIKSDSDIILIPLFEICGNSIAALISMNLLKKCKICFLVGDARSWLKDLRQSSVYFFSNFATTIFGAMTTVITGIYLDSRDVAYWSLCMQIVTMAKSLYNPITNTIYPHMVLNKDLKLIKIVSIIFVIPLFISSCIIFFLGNRIMTFVGGENYYYVGTLLKYLIPVFIVSFYSMLFGWPVLGAIDLIKETTLTTIAAAIIQIICIALLILFNKFSLVHLTMCCNISEISFLIFRLNVFKKNIKKFSKKALAK